MLHIFSINQVKVIDAQNRGDKHLETLRLESIPLNHLGYPTPKT
jgi:hypothetical protein